MCFNKPLLDQLNLRYNQRSTLTRNENTMLSIIIQAAENFCQHQLHLPFKQTVKASKKRTFFAYIDIDVQNSNRHRVYIGCDDVLIQTIVEIFLGENNSDEQTIIDMLLETTNMIVGSAKILAKESYDISFAILTPFFVSNTILIESMEYVQHLDVKNGTMILALQRL